MGDHVLKWFSGAEVVLPFGPKLFCHVYSHAHPRPFHAHGEGGEFDVAEDTPRVQENIHAKFHENWLSIMAVHREHTHTHTHTRKHMHKHTYTQPNKQTNQQTNTRTKTHKQ